MLNKARNQSIGSAITFPQPAIFKKIKHKNFFVWTFSQEQRWANVVGLEREKKLNLKIYARQVVEVRRDSARSFLPLPIPNGMNHILFYLAILLSLLSCITDKGYLELWKA